MRVPVVLAVSIAAAALSALCLRPAAGATDATGELAAGGVARGDISKTAGETDTIGVVLSRGSRVDIKWSAGFPAAVSLTDPDGAPVDLGLAASRTASLPDWEVPATGRYQFRISSSDGTQGVYVLQVRPHWDKTVTFDGTGEASFDLPMPAASFVKGKVEPLPGASNPSILSLLSPSSQELLVAPVVGTVGIAKLKAISCAEAGVYRFTARADAGTQQFRATLKRKTLREPRTKIDITNGLDQISFANDGVAQLFSNRCATCHSWAASYTGVRAFAKDAITRMKSGSMPPGGPRIDADSIALVNEWIVTGYAR